MNTTLLSMPGVPEMILIVGAILLLFGGKKIPELMKGLGSGIKEFKKASKEDEVSLKPEGQNTPITEKTSE